MKDSPAFRILICLARYRRAITGIGILEIYSSTHATAWRNPVEAVDVVGLGFRNACNLGINYHTLMDQAPCFI